MRPPRLFLIAGEPSGDQLGAGLMLALSKKTRQEAVFSGIGGSAMIEQGLVSLFPMRDLSVMGFTEIVPHLPRLMDRVRQTVEAVEAFAPDALITIDSPGFVNRVVSALKKRGKVTPKFIHYVAPSVWAYKPERAKKAARLFDHLMVLLPFELPYFAKEGLATTFVGHPVVNDLDICFTRHLPANRRAVNQLTLCLLPGSRQGEVSRLLPVFRKTVELLRPYYPDLRIVMPITADMLPEFERRTAQWAIKPRFVTGIIEKYEAFYQSHVALAKSGTVTLEVAKCGLPMVMAYRVSPLSATIARRLMITKYFNLINVLEKQEIIPECVQENCTPAKLAAALRALIDSPKEAEAQKQAAYKALKRMQPHGGISASDRAADVVLDLIRPLLRAG